MRRNIHPRKQDTIKGLAIRMVYLISGLILGVILVHGQVRYINAQNKKLELKNLLYLQPQSELHLKGVDRQWQRIDV